MRWWVRLVMVVMVCFLLWVGNGVISSFLLREW